MLRFAIQVFLFLELYYLMHNCFLVAHRKRKHKKKCIKQLDLVENLLQRLQMKEIYYIQSKEFKTLGELVVLSKYLDMIHAFLKEANYNKKSHLRDQIDNYELRVLSSRVSTQDDTPTNILTENRKSFLNLSLNQSGGMK